ncbi:MAG: ecotin family protein [Thiolinea sp.]
MNIRKSLVVSGMLAVALGLGGYAQATSPQAPQGNPASYKYGMKPYPAARPGYTRLTIHLPERANEQHLKVELLPGKYMTTDCNVSHFSGSLASKTAQGWGFPYYEVANLRGPMQTRMRCPEGQQKKGVVPVYMGNQAIIDYNSKLPVVVYAPNGYNVQYRVLVPQQQGAASPE